MRVLLGAECVLNICRHRIRWYRKSHLPSKKLYDMEIKGLEARQFKIFQRLKSGRGKEPETPALEIFCQALASAKKTGDVGKSKKPITNSSEGQVPTGSISPTLKINPSITSTIKVNNQIQSISQSEPLLAELKTPEIFKCKNCFEYNSVTNQCSSEMMIVNCKDCNGDDTDLTKEPIKGMAMANSENQSYSVIKDLSKSPPKPTVSQAPSPKIAAPPNPKTPDQSPLAERFAMPQKLAFPIGRNPCVDGKKDAKESKCPPPKPKPKSCGSAKDELKPPKGETSTKSKAPIKTLPLVETKAAEKQNDPLSAKPKEMPKAPPPNKPQADKPALPPSVGVSGTQGASFPRGRNPCTDGKKEAKELKCPAAKPEPKKEPKPKKCDKEKPKKLVRKCGQETKKEKKKESPVKGSAPKSMPESPEPVAPKTKLKKKPLRQGAVDPKETPMKPTKPPVKAKAHPKSAPKKEELPPLPSDSFSMPLMSAFPMGRNPCRDGPRGAGKGKDASPCGAKITPCASKTNSCTSLNTKPEREDKLPVPPNPSKSPAKKESSKSSVPPTVKEIKENVLEKQKKPSTDATPPAAKSPLPTPPPIKEIKESTENLLENKGKTAMNDPIPSAVKENTSLKDPIPPAAKTPPPPPAAKAPSISPQPLAKEQSKSPEVLSQEKIKSSSKPPSSESIPMAKEVPKNCSKQVPKSSESSDLKRSSEIKKFPALPLKQSLASYISSIEPFLTEEEFKEEQKITKDFGENEGVELQRLLEAEAERCSNWLTPRWTRSAYLSYRAPLTIFSSPGLAFPIQVFNEPTDFLNFTAKAIYGICEFKNLVDKNQIPEVKMGRNSLDNSQFFKIFGTIRKPGRFCDTIEQFNDSNYIVVVYNNNYFKLPIFLENGKCLPVPSITEALEKIMNCPVEKGEPFGVLTHDNRSNWAEAYTALRCPHGNADTVDIIEESLFLVCLDKCVDVPDGKDRSVQAHQLLHGGGLKQNSANRWMDKAIQLVVNPNGLAGFCYEHSPADCQPLAMLMDFVQEKVQNEEYGYEETDTDSNKDVPLTLLKFQPVNECINLWMCEAKRTINKLSSKLQMNVFQFECHGKCFIKAQGLNPDSYIQLALSLAYYSMHKDIPAQYESAHLRIFCEGRTETIRSTSNHSKAFVLAMQSKETSINEKLETLQKAVDAHETLTKEAISGQGIDRHLFGLQEMALENSMPLPEFFLSKGFMKSVTFQLFTSQVATSHDGFMSFGPLIFNGYGVCYNLHDDKVTFSISSWETCPQISSVKYSKAIKRSLNDMRRLILQTGGDCVGQNPCKCD